MENYLKATAIILVVILLHACLSKQAKDFSILLCVLACCFIASASVSYLQQILHFAEKVSAVTKMNEESFTILLKAVGIGILGEIVMHLCEDSGNSALSKMMNFLTASAVLWISLPLFTSLIELIEGVLSAT